MKKYHIGLIIGRFQPFHQGHLYLVKEGLKRADKMVIGIGSSNISDVDNPFSVEQRENMIRDALIHEKLADKIIKIVPLPDNPSDEEWLQNTIKLTEPIDLILGNNDWVNDLFRNAGYAIMAVPFYKRDIYEGKKIRRQMRKEGKLREIFT